MKQLLSIKINAKPMPSPRPRLGRGGTFMPKKYTAHKKEIQGYFTGFKMLPFEKITIEIKLTFTKAKSASKNKYPLPIGDVDNYAKTYLDAMNGIVYEDDVLVEKLIVSKFYADKNSIKINIYRSCIL